ncbi:MAG: hypothetical protein MAG451_01834 [Anaerolineales bacterium]|nr:hypothetical protein [Anaerolineales bacterium]
MGEEHRSAWSSEHKPAARWLCWASLVSLLTLLAGCVPQRDISQPHHSQPAGEIWGAQTVGQTFVARESSLNRIDVFLATYARTNSGPVAFHLRESPDAGHDLATVTFNAADIEDNAYRTFTFPPLSNSQAQSYYFFFEATDAKPGNAITVWASPIDSYSDGQAYIAGQPQAGDLHFRTYAEYTIFETGHDLGYGLWRHAGTAALAMLLFLMPGAAVLSVLSWKLSSPTEVLHNRRRYPDRGVGDIGQETSSSVVQETSSSVGRGTSSSVVQGTSSNFMSGDWRLGIGGWEFVILSAGLSVAIAPLLILFASLAGLHLSRGSVIVLLILSIVLAALPNLHRWLHLAPPSPQLPLSPAPPLRSPPAPLLFIILTISLAARLLTVRDLPAPMWGDSYHHTLIAQLLVDHGGLFQSWEPYVPLESFTYHFGFHSNVALFHWLTGVPILESVIVVGQILNALASLALYPLVRRLGGSAWAGTIAVLIASLLSPMPAFYVNWGRYTQLTGMVVLPVAATLLIEATTGEARTWRRLLLAGIGVAGLFLSHYLVTLLFLPFALAYLVWLSVTRVRLVRAWLRAGVVGLIAGTLLTPWLVNLWRGLLPRILASRLSSGSRATYFQTAYNAVGEVLLYVPAWLIVLAVAGALWSLWRRRPLALVTGLWTALLILMANPNVVGLPGAGVVHNFMLLIALYLPLSMLAGAGLGDTIGDIIGDIIEQVAGIEERFRARRSTTEGVTTSRVPPSPKVGRGGLGGRGPSYSRLAAAVLIVVAGLIGARLRLMDLDYAYQLVTPADGEAMAWIREYTPDGAKFLVNSFTAFGGHTVVGDDAGWWIPYLAGRRNTVPPAIYGLEVPRDPGYPTRVRDFHRAVTSQPPDSAETLNMLRANGITHVYIGATGGERLDPTVLMESPAYEPVYQRDGVMIFKIQLADHHPRQPDSESVRSLHR